jgi:hypothetical protein
MLGLLETDTLEEAEAALQRADPHARLAAMEQELFCAEQELEILRGQLATRTQQRDDMIHALGLEVDMESELAGGDGVQVGVCMCVGACIVCVCVCVYVLAWSGG